MLLLCDSIGMVDRSGRMTVALAIVTGEIGDVICGHGSMMNRGVMVDCSP